MVIRKVRTGMMPPAATPPKMRLMNRTVSPGAAEGSNPLLLYAYGSYGASMDAYFSSVRLSLLDRGFLFGDSVYEVLPAFGGRMFLFTEHFDRLARSLNAAVTDAPMAAVIGLRAAYYVQDYEKLADQATFIEAQRKTA